MNDVLVDNYCMWKDIWIPLVCALFSGLVTFLGIFITIKYERKKSRQEYIEKIRPFIVIDSYLTTNADLKQAIDIVVNTKAESEEKNEGATVYRLDSFLLTNCGEAVFTVDYLKINNSSYECIYKTSIKPNDNAQIWLKPIPVFQTDIGVKNIRIGVSDRQSNQYEYELLFEITEKKNQDSLSHLCKESIIIKSVNCSKNLYKR